MPEGLNDDGVQDDLPSIEDLGGRSHRLVMQDGTSVRYATFEPSTAEGATLLLPGYTEFIEKHLEVVGDLLARQQKVIVLDWRGQGLSDRALADRHKGHVADMDLFLSDLEAVLDACGWFQEGGVPNTVVGHSMGGHLTLRAIARRPDIADKVVVMAPMIDIFTGPAPRWLAPLVMEAASFFGLGERYVPGGGGYDPESRPFESNKLTHDPVRFQRMHDYIVQNPDLAISAPTFGWVRAALRSIERLKTEALRIAQPVLILGASDEEIVDNAAQVRLAAQMRDCRRIEIADARHELMQERDAARNAAWAEIDRFVGWREGPRQ